jgi:hypothetical protein
MRILQAKSDLTGSKNHPFDIIPLMRIFSVANVRPGKLFSEIVRINDIQCQGH